ncbi:MAG: hypothetical protein ACREPA_05975 [Candidatus Dormibacteraceae bacterium]
MSLRLGKLSPRRPVGLKDLDHYVALPTAPGKVDYLSAVSSFPMACNSEIGDCVVAGFIHQNQVGSAETAEPYRYPGDAAGEQAYFSLTGGQDSGLVIASFLGTCRTQGVLGKKLEAYAPVHPRNQPTMRAALWLFGNVKVGVQLPESAMQQFQLGQPWEYVGDTDIIGGHDIEAVGYDGHCWYFVSWGRVQPPPGAGLPPTPTRPGRASARSSSPLGAAPPDSISRA